MTTEVQDHNPPKSSQPDEGGAEIIPFRRPTAPGSAPDSAPPPAPEPDDHHPDDDGPSAA